MKSLYIGKTIYNNQQTLILTDGFNFAPLSFINSFDDLLQMTHDDLVKIQTIPLKHKLTNVSANLIENQKVWGTGNTYEWSNEKINSLDPNHPYKKVYFSKRPMFFLKGDQSNHSMLNDYIGIRDDSEINIPEAELVALFSSRGDLVGFTIGNDQTALSLETDNPLYQFQAKHFYKSHSFLPLIILNHDIKHFDISLTIKRHSIEIININYSTLKFEKSLDEIKSYLFKSNNHPYGIFLFLGFNSSYDRDFTLKSGDEITISSPQFPLKLIQTCKPTSELL